MYAVRNKGRMEKTSTSMQTLGFEPAAIMVNCDVSAERLSDAVQDGRGGQLCRWTVLALSSDVRETKQMCPIHRKNAKTSKRAQGWVKHLNGALGLIQWEPEKLPYFRFWVRYEPRMAWCEVQTLLLCYVPSPYIWTKQLHWKVGRQELHRSRYTCQNSST